MRRTARAAVVVTVTAAALGAGVAAGAAPAPASITVIATHLNNPRGVAIGPNGGVWVAEAGKAGGPCLSKRPCVGTTGSLTRWVNGRTRRLVSGLISVERSDGSLLSGANGVSVGGGVFIATADAPGCRVPQGLPSNALGMLGGLLRYTNRYGVTRHADLRGAECAHNYDRGTRSSNPYAVLAIDANRQVVVDAAANTLFEVTGASVRPLAVFPRTAFGAQSAPTSVAQGPDGTLYVGELAGDAAQGARARRWAARIWRVTPGSTRPVVHARGFNAISGLAVARDGTMFVTEWTVNPRDRDEARGDVVRIAPDGRRTRLGFGELHFPSGAAVSSDGRTLYVANWSILTDTPPASGPFAGKTGELVRISIG
jgi:sugar lactone lactonase YvrE